MRVWGVLVGLYGLDLVASQPDAHATEVGFCLAASAVVLAVRVSRRAAGLVSVVALVALLGPAQSTETALVMWVSVALAMFDGAELAAACRVVVAAAYGFAAANKLLSPFLSGSILEQYVPGLPFPALIAPVVVAVEFGLAAAVWFRWRWATAAIVAFHVPVAFLVGVDWHHTASLLLYGAMMALGQSGGGDVRRLAATDVQGAAGVLEHPAEDVVRG